MKKDKKKTDFWSSFEKFKSSMEFIVVLLVLTPFIFSTLKLVKQGLTAVAPAWLVIITALFALLLGYVLGHRTATVARSKTSLQNVMLLQEIKFDYQDGPTAHGWKILQENGKTPPSFLSIIDGFVGKALDIKSTDWYGMDILVNPNAEIGTRIEFVVKVERDFGIYAKTCIQSKVGAETKNTWLNFKIGQIEPEPFGDGAHEWIVYVVPEPFGGDWLLFRVDLRDSIRRTFGRNGWEMQRLLGFRLRGSLSIAYIHIY